MSFRGSLISTLAAIERIELLAPTASNVAANTSVLDTISAADLPMDAIMEVNAATSAGGVGIRTRAFSADGIGPIPIRYASGTGSATLFAAPRGGDLEVRCANPEPAERTITRSIVALRGATWSDVERIARTYVPPIHSAALGAGVTSAVTVAGSTNRHDRLQGWVIATEPYDVSITRYSALSDHSQYLGVTQLVAAGVAAGVTTLIDEPYGATGHISFGVKNVGAVAAVVDYFVMAI